MTLFLVVVSKGSVNVVEVLSKIDVSCLFYIYVMFLNYDSQQHSQQHDVLA